MVETYTPCCQASSAQVVRGVWATPLGLEFESRWEQIFRLVGKKKKNPAAYHHFPKHVKGPGLCSQGYGAHRLPKG
jgi:hypothetical protein